MCELRIGRSVTMQLPTVLLATTLLVTRFLVLDYSDSGVHAQTQSETRVRKTMYYTVFKQDPHERWL